MIINDKKTEYLENAILELSKYVTLHRILMLKVKARSWHTSNFKANNLLNTL